MSTRRSGTHRPRNALHKRSVALLVLDLTLLLKQLPLERFSLAVLDRRGLFKVLTLLPFANNAFFFNHSLEALNGALEMLVIINPDVRDT